MGSPEVMQRPLGPQEVVFAELTRRSNGGIQLVCVAAFEAPADDAAVCAALKRIHERHPMLRGRVDDRETAWWVCDVPFEQIEIRTEPMGEAFDLEAFYAGEARTPIDIARTAWRAVLLTDSAGRVAWIALVTNHGAIDGRSALVVLNDLDILLHEPDAWSDDSLPLLLPAEAGLAAAGLKGDRNLLPVWPPETMWQVARAVAAAGRKPHAFLRVVPDTTVAALHDRLIADGVHLAAAFAAAAVHAARALPGRTDWTGVVAPTDVRADCTPAIPGDAVGEYVAGISLLLGPDHDGANLLETARELQDQFLRNRPPSLLMDPDVPNDVSRGQVDQMAAASDVFGGGICVSDIGDLNRLSGRRVGYGKVLVMPSQNHGIHSVMVAIVSTNEGACLSIGYDEPLQTRANAHAFADRYLEALEELARGGAVED
jgi:hypothetical protein